MAALDFPPSPVDGQTYTSGSTTWTYNAAYGVWRITSTICYRDWETDRKSIRLNSSHLKLSRMPSSA